MQVFLHVYIYIFLKQEKPKMDDFKRKKKFGSKGKNIKKKLLKMSKFLMDNLAKISQYIFSYSCVSEHSISLFFYFFFKRIS